MHEQKRSVKQLFEKCFPHLWVMRMIMSTLFFKHIRYVTTENDKKNLISFNVTSLPTNFPISDTLNIMNYHVSNNHEFIRKTFIAQYQHTDLVFLALATT